MTRNIIYCLWIEWHIFPFADKINKLPENKNENMKVPITSHKQKIRVAKRMFILQHGTWKDNIRSVISDRRQRSSGHSKEGEKSAGFTSGGEKPASHSSRLVSSSCVFSGHHTTSQKGSSPQKKDMCEPSLSVFLLHTIVAIKEWKYELYFYISTSPSLFVQRFNMQHLQEK